MLLAARGVRNLDEGVEPMPDAASVRYLKRRSMWVQVKALATSLALTALGVAWKLSYPFDPTSAIGSR